MLSLLFALSLQISQPATTPDVQPAPSQEQPVSVATKSFSKEFLRLDPRMLMAAAGIALASSVPVATLTAVGLAAALCGFTINGRLPMPVGKKPDGTAINLQSLALYSGVGLLAGAAAAVVAGIWGAGTTVAAWSIADRVEGER